jgi:hypothetical protein
MRLRVLFGGLFLETAGLAWDIVLHLRGATETARLVTSTSALVVTGEELLTFPHMTIFLGFVISFVGAVMVYRNLRTHVQ